MIVWPGLRRSMGTRAGIPIANRAAHFDASLGITSSGGFASAWADQSGNARNLLQATGANQPIHLPFVGTKYAANFGVANNYITTPSATANQITGDKTLILTGLKLGALAVGNYQAIYDKYAALAASGFSLYQDTGLSGKLLYGHHTGGSLRSALSSVTMASAGITAQTAFDFAVTHNTTTGVVKMHYKLSGGAWTQLGADIASTAGATTLGTNAVGLFNRAAEPANVYVNTGSVERVKLYDGLVTDLDAGTGGTLKQDMTPNAWTSGTTFVSSTTGETYTITSTGAKPAQIVDRPSLLFDGSAHFMKCNAFTLNQPETLYWVGKQISWTGSDVIADGNAANTLRFYQTTASPQLFIYGGASLVGPVSSLAVGDKGVVGIVVNGDASSMQHNLNTAVTGAGFGAANMGGLTLGAKGDLVGFGNIQVYQALIYNTAHDASTRAAIIRALMAKWGIA